MDYVQLLMSSQAIWEKTVNRNAKRQKRHPKSSKNKMFIFGLCSTFDDGPSWSMDSKPICSPLQPIKCNAHFWITFNFCWLAGLVDGLEPHLPPVSSQKNEMLIFGLHSTSDDRPSNLSKKRWPKHKKNKKGLLSHWKIKCSFLDYVQLLMISRAILSKKHQPKDQKNPKMPPKSSKNKMFVFGLHSTSDDWLSDLSKKRWPKCQ